MTSQREKTSAEKALIEQCEQKLNEIRQNGLLNPAREQALELLKSAGLPSRHIENWHYTDLHTLFKNIPPVNNQSIRCKPALTDQGDVFISHCGVTSPIEKNTNFHIQSLKEKIETLPLNTHILAKDDAIGIINTALATDGWDIHIPAGTNVKHPIELQNIQKGGQNHLFSRINVGAHAKCTIISRQISDDEENFITMLSELEIEEGAEVIWIITRENGLNSIDFNRLTAKLHEKSNLTFFLINAGTNLNRQEIHITLEGKEANFQLRGINLLSRQSHTDTTMVVRHLSENTTSTEIMRNVVMDKARGVFQGMIRVAQLAQKTDARMACNSLILSDDAEFDAKPELEIFADDVACGHGATVAEINKDHLYYLMARGIPEAEARGLMIKAFVSELVDEIGNEDSQCALLEIIDNWLNNHL